MGDELMKRNFNKNKVERNTFPASRRIEIYS